MIYWMICTRFSPRYFGEPHENIYLWYELHPAATDWDAWGDEGYANGNWMGPEMPNWELVLCLPPWIVALMIVWWRRTIWKHLSLIWTSPCRHWLRWLRWRRICQQCQQILLTGCIIFTVRRTPWKHPSLTWDRCFQQVQDSPLRWAIFMGSLPSCRDSGFSTG